ncbi:MAG: cytochrome c [Nitrospirae bacterium]|nr:MAG: cytochrome c [Nitrospirota bacterium]
MMGTWRARRWVIPVSVVGLCVVVVMSGCVLFEDERTAKGRKLYNHYCMHCHGEHGRQGEGYNWQHMPDPRPRDLSDEATMSTFSDEEIFSTIYRDMKDTTPEVGDPIGDEEFAVPTMPTFKYTLSEEEIWDVVGYVRTLHGMSLTYDVEARKKQLEQDLKAAEEELKQAQAALAAAEQRMAEAEAQAASADVGTDVDESEEDVADEEMDEEEVVLPEEIALEKAQLRYEQAKKAWENFTKRPRRLNIPRPDLNVSDDERAELEKLGKRLYENKYGCHACHSINQQGGIVGPPLDRAGFRLNGTWIYRWILYPQGIKKHTRMPNLGVTEDDAKALTFFLKTLRAPKPDRPIPPPE